MNDIAALIAYHAGQATAPAPAGPAPVEVSDLAARTQERFDTVGLPRLGWVR